MLKGSPAKTVAHRVITAVKFFSPVSLSGPHKGETKANG